MQRGKPFVECNKTIVVGKGAMENTFVGVRLTVTEIEEN